MSTRTGQGRASVEATERLCGSHRGPAQNPLLPPWVLALPSATVKASAAAMLAAAKASAAEAEADAEADAEAAVAARTLLVV